MSSPSSARASTAPPLGGLPVDTFLTEYWQTRPLVIRGAIPGFRSPISADEVAGLACEEDVESRLVQERGASKRWQVKHGPFKEKALRGLPETGWSLLVQAVDHWVPEVADLLARFDFIPNWRRDDLMISVAPKGGSVGPHYDHYDVFLLQGQGKRRWRVGPRQTPDSALLADTDLRILADPFDAIEDVVLGPGDMLYLPPLYAHEGVAEEDNCLTLSIGFRAPAVSEMITGFAAAVAEDLSEFDRYADPDLAAQPNPGEITPAALERVARLMLQRLDDPAMLARWFGVTMTEPKYDGIARPPEEEITPEEVAEALRAGEALRHNEGSRFAYVRMPSGPGTAGGNGHATPPQDAVLLFVDGEGFECGGAASQVAIALCDGPDVPADRLAPALENPEALAMLTLLLNAGALYAR